MKKTELGLLIVDDEKNMARALRDIFSAKGYPAQAAYSGPVALDMIRKGGFDCVLSDLKMPGMNGVELHRAIQAARPGLPVVLMTAYAADHLIREGLEEGVITALTKPLDIDAILLFLAALTEKKSVVIVDGDSGFCETLGDALRTRDLSTCLERSADGNSEKYWEGGIKKRGTNPWMKKRLFWLSMTTRTT